MRLEKYHAIINNVMEGQTQELSKNPVERNESLKPFSDAQLVNELKKRLGSNPKVDPVIVQELQSITTELQEKAKAAKPLPVEPEKSAEASVPVAAVVVDSKQETSAESSVESEGKKWARIIREKGVGLLDGKFRRDWTYLQDDGKLVKIAEHADMGFTVAGLIGAGYQDRREINLLQGFDIDNNVAIPLAGRDIVSHEFNMGRESRANFLQITPLGPRKDRFSNGIIIRYLAWLDRRSGDSRGETPFGFTFVLPEKEKREFGHVLEKNIDVIEDIFQNVYPGLTGEKGANRMIVEKLIVVDPDDNIKGWMGGKREGKLSFSRPVGETPWTK